MNQQDAILGIDVGTQSCKCVVLDTNGHILGVGQQNYDVMTSHPQWAEQDPAVWWDALVNSTRAAMHQANLAPPQICGVGLTGQMHGIVLIGQDHEPVYPAIIWMDRRSATVYHILCKRHGRAKLERWRHSRPERKNNHA